MNTYLLFKSIHLIAVISWMAGLLYLPRIFVYHAETRNNEEKNNTFKIFVGVSSIEIYSSKTFFTKLRFKEIYNFSKILRTIERKI